MVVPMGILRRGRQLPVTIGALDPDNNLSPTFNPLLESIYLFSPSA